MHHLNFLTMKTKNCVLLLLFVFLLSCQIDKLHEDLETEIINCPIDISFDIINNNCSAPCEISFSNITENATSFEWDFGNGTSSTSGNPTAIFDNPGEYNITLTASDGVCEEMLTKSVTIEWSSFLKTFGGTEGDWGYDLIQAADGSYVIAGGKSVNTSSGASHYLIKTFSDGNLDWEGTYGGISWDGTYAFTPTIDGSYMLTGYTDGDGNTDVFVVEANSSGIELNSGPYGGNGDESGRAIQQTPEGDFIILGTTNSSGAGGDDFYLLKINGLGTEEWTKTFGGAGFEEAFGLAIDSDGNYLMVGYTDSFDEPNGEVFLVKTNSDGETLWTKSYPEMSTSVGSTIINTTDGGAIIAGGVGDEVLETSNALLIKINNQGEKEWSQTYGTAQGQTAQDVYQTADGGFVFTGIQSTSNGAVVNFDIYLVKTDANGNEEWSRTFGEGENDYGNAVIQTIDGGYAIAGATGSYGQGGGDVILIKTDDQGNIQ